MGGIQLMQLRLTAARIVDRTESLLLCGWVNIEGEQIERVGRGTLPKDEVRTVNLAVLNRHTAVEFTVSQPA